MKTPARRTVLALASLLLTPALVQAEAKPRTLTETPEQRDGRMKWHRDARFGMFVHWGIYSVVGGEYNGRKLPNSAEWMMCRGKIPIAEYKRYADQFNPTRFDADAFVKLAKDAGMKYLVITAKHHDGFSMFGSKCSSYNVVEATPFKRDIMKELAEACRKQGIKFGFYYSQAQDWHHPGGFGNNWDKTIKRVSSDEYVRDKVVPEVRQLLTDYGPIGIFWWDTPRKMSQEAFESLYSLTSIQPDIITNDRLGEDYPGDYKTFERNIPAAGPAGKDWEVCMPISGSWGYKKGDNDFKSTSTLIRNLADISSKGGNYLLNVSPTGEGTLLPQAVERLKAVGKWMKTNSESIHGTTASPFAKLDWGRCTKKVHAGGTTLYLHVFDWPEDGQLLIPGLKNDVKQSCLLADGSPLKTRREEPDTVVLLPPQAPDAIDSVIVMQVEGALEIEEQGMRQARDGSVILTAATAYIHNNEGGVNARLQDRGDDPDNIGYWVDPEASVEWAFKITKPGSFEVIAEIALEVDSRFEVVTKDQKISAQVSATGGYGKYKKLPLGSLRIDAAGDHTLRIKPDAEHWQPINVRQVELKLR